MLSALAVRVKSRLPEHLQRAPSREGEKAPQRHGPAPAASARSPTFSIHGRGPFRHSRPSSPQPRPSPSRPALPPVPPSPSHRPTVQCRHPLPSQPPRRPPARTVCTAAPPSCPAPVLHPYRTRPEPRSSTALLPLPPQIAPWRQLHRTASLPCPIASSPCNSGMPVREPSTALDTAVCKHHLTRLSASHTIQAKQPVCQQTYIHIHPPWYLLLSAPVSTVCNPQTSQLLSEAGCNSTRSAARLRQPARPTTCPARVRRRVPNAILRCSTLNSSPGRDTALQSHVSITPQLTEPPSPPLHGTSPARGHGQSERYHTGCTSLPAFLSFMSRHVGSCH